MIHHITITDNQGVRYRYLMHTQYQERANQLVELDYMVRDAITIERDSDSLYKPYKCSRATARLYTDSILSLLPAYGHRNICGIIQREERGEWVTLFSGISTDSTYNQGYVSDFDVFEVQYQDLLSTLRYVPFDPTDYNGMQQWTLYDLLITALRKVGGYRHVYITDTLNTNINPQKNIFEVLSINKANFVDSEGDKSKNWSYLDIIEETCKYLCLTIVPEGDKVYILSYDAIRAGYNWYNHYEVDIERRGNDDPRNAYLYPSMSLVYNHVGRVLLYDHIELSAKHIASNDTNITIHGQTERIVVKCELNPYDKISPDYDNPDHYVVSQSHSQLTGKEYNNTYYFTNPPRKAFSYVERYMLLQDGKGNAVEFDEVETIPHGELGITNPRITDNGNDEDVLVVRSYDRHMDYQTSVLHHDVNDLYIRFLQPDYLAKSGVSVQRKGYGMIGSLITDDNSIYEPANITYDNLIRGKSIGVYPIQYAKISASKPEDRAKLDKVSYLFHSLPKYPKNSPIITQRTPLLTLRIDNVPYAKGKYLLVNMDWTAYLGKLLMSSNETDYHSNLAYAYVEVYLRLGNRYWDGTKWQPQRVLCKLPIDAKDKSERPFGKTYKLKNTILAKHFIGDKRGYHIPLHNPTDSKDSMSFEQLQIEIPLQHWWHTLEREAGPIHRDFWSAREDNDMFTLPESVILSDLSIEVLSKGKVSYTDKDDDEDEVEYSNLVLYPQYETAEPIELKLSTNTNGQHNKSTVYQSYLGEQYRLGSIYNKANGELLSAEQHIIANHLRQYETPTITLSTTLHLNKCNIKPYTTIGYKHIGRDKIMITNSISVDYIDNKIHVELIEKK